MENLVSLKNVTKKYGDKCVVDQVELSISAGQIIGLVGPNGAGKTTCLQSLLGLTNYDGEIDVLGFKPKSQRTEMLKEVAYIADVAVLPKWITGLQLLSYMEDSHPKFNRAKAESFLAKTNIRLTSKVSQLSKGMVVQLHLALILAIDAKVLVLDEPTLGLDLLTRRQFYSHLLEEFYTEEKCILITTHQIEEIEHILTDVAFIQDGKIVLAESTEHIKERFKLVAVSSENEAQASSLKPLTSNSLMGITTMLFDGADTAALSVMGKVSTPSLADVFVGVMSKEVC